MLCAGLADVKTPVKRGGALRNGIALALGVLCVLGDEEPFGAKVAKSAR
jgi:hypothetical protein